LANRTAKVVLLGLLIVALVIGEASCQSASSKAEMLRILTQCAKTQVQSQAAHAAKTSRLEASQLGLDLVFYSWALNQIGKPVDIKNLDLIVPALAKELKDQTITWAINFFSISPGEKNESQLPPRGDERVQKLFDLKTKLKSAIDYKKSSPVQAVTALQAATALCQELHLDLGEAFVLKQLGDHYLYDMTRYALAEACYERPAWTFPAYRCWASSASVYNDFAYLNAETGRYATATEYYIESARHWEQMANQDPSRYKYRNLAGQQYIKAGSTAGNYERSLELMRIKGLGQIQIWAIATKSYDILIKSLMEVADFCRSAGDPATSLDLLKQAQKTCEKQEDTLLTAKVLEGLAKTYAMLGQSSNASAALAKQIQVLKSTASAGSAALTKLNSNLKIPRQEQTRLLKLAERGAIAYDALKDHNRAANAWRKTAEVFGKISDVDGRIRCLRALGATLDASGKPRESLEARREAVMMARRAGQNALAASIVQEMIQSFIALNDLDNALEGFTELVPIIEEAGNIRGAVQVLEARGLLLAKQGRPEEAIRDLSNARNRYLVQVGDVWAAANVSLELAHAMIASQKTKEAIETLEATIEELESSYGYESFGSRMVERRLNTIRELYRELLTNYVHTGQTESAANLTRRGKRHPWFSKLMMEMRNNASDPTVAAWAKSVDVIIIEGSHSNEQDHPDRLLAKDWTGFVESCFRLELQHPREYKTMPIDPVELLKRRDGLPQGLLAIAYMQAETSLYVFICGNKTSICRQIGTQKNSVDALVSRLRRTLKNCEESLGAGIPIPPIVTWQEAAFIEIKEPLKELYMQLVAPIRDDLEGNTRLAFILPDELAGLPMHALISSERDSKPTFLVEDFEISYLARGMLDDLVSNESRGIDPSSDSLKVFADPEDNLPGARKESTNITAAYPVSQSFVGRNEATTTKFLAECSQAGIVHIAAHHRLDPNPTGFQILLAPSATSDGTITLKELSTIRNPYLQLVVLSACDSIGSTDPISLGPARTAELFSLIGAKSVMGGLWKVSDESASKLMETFYKGLSRGKSRAEALQSAQRTMIESKQFAHPFYWACFALYGNPR
jgi:tetratricopeptide (TPR) repeat protein